MKNSQNTKKFKTADMAYIALFAVIISVSAWICVPGPVPFTLQTFAVFAAVGILGGKRGMMSLVLYLLLGFVGLPVFSGGVGGVAVLVGPSGGFLIGFLPAAALCRLFTNMARNKNRGFIAGMGAGLAACYACGVLWLMFGFTGTAGPGTLGVALARYVLPYIPADICKCALAFALTKILEKRLGRRVQ